MIEEGTIGPEDEDEEEGLEEEVEQEEGETGSVAQGQRMMELDGAEMQALRLVAGFGQPEGPGPNDQDAGFPPVALPPPQHRRNVTFCCFWSWKFRCKFLTPVQQVAVATRSARLVCERQVRYGFCKHAGIDHI